MPHVPIPNIPRPKCVDWEGSSRRHKNLNQQTVSVSLPTLENNCSVSQFTVDYGLSKVEFRHYQVSKLWEHLDTNKGAYRNVIRGYIQNQLTHTHQWMAKSNLGTTGINKKLLLSYRSGKRCVNEFTCISRLISIESSVKLIPARRPTKVFKRNGSASRWFERPVGWHRLRRRNWNQCRVQRSYKRFWRKRKITVLLSAW